jgi:spore coat protein U-like protein
MTGFRLISAIMAAAFAAAPIAVSAKTLTNSLNARLQVDTSCRIFTEPLAFGNANIFSGVINAQATIRLRCGPQVAYSVAIDNGQNFSGGNRRMYSGAPFVPYVTYQIYRNAARTQVWGSTAGNVVTGTTPVNGDVDLIAYGQVPGGIIWPAAYVDVVTVTVTF